MSGLEILLLIDSIALVAVCIGLSWYYYQYFKFKQHTEHALEESDFTNAKAAICYLKYLQECKENFIEDEEYESVPDIQKAIETEEKYLGITDEVKKNNPKGIILN